MSSGITKEIRPRKKEWRGNMGGTREEIPRKGLRPRRPELQGRGAGLKPQSYILKTWGLWRGRWAEN